MENRKRIIELLTAVRYTTNDIEKVADEICSLFNVVGQSEQLKCDCCNGTGMVEGDYRDEFESCLTCNGRGTF